MKQSRNVSAVSLRMLHRFLATIAAAMVAAMPALAQFSPPPSELVSWSDGAAKQAIFDFVRATIDRSSPSYVTPEDRIAVFDQDGTLWVEHPMYSQVVYA